MVLYYTTPQQTTRERKTNGVKWEIGMRYKEKITERKSKEDREN